MGDRPNAITWHLAIPAETTSWSGERGVAFFEYLMCERQHRNTLQVLLYLIFEIILYSKHFLKFFT